MHWSTRGDEPVRLAVLLVVFTAPAGSTLVGCGGSGCLGIAVTGLHATVLDGAVIGSRSLVAALEATFEGRTATTPNVNVGNDGCHVITQDVQLVLPAR